MQLIVSKEKVVNYTAKYATKAETRSQTLKDIFSEILKDPNCNILKYVQKEISGTIADRDFSVQETMTLLQEIPNTVQDKQCPQLVSMPTVCEVVFFDVYTALITPEGI